MVFSVSLEKGQKAAEAMFGFIWQQPVHKTLRDMRFVTLIILACSIDIMYRLVSILEQAALMTNGQATGTIAATVGTLAAGIFAAIWKGIASLHEGNKADA